jgi:hypothetical protein
MQYINSNNYENKSCSNYKIILESEDDEEAAVAAYEEIILKKIKIEQKKYLF